MIHSFLPCSGEALGLYFTGTPLFVTFFSDCYAYLLYFVF